MQASKSSSDEDDAPQQAVQARDVRGWSQEDVAILKKGMQVHGHQWSKIQVGSLLSSPVGQGHGPAALACRISLLLGSIGGEASAVVHGHQWPECKWAGCWARCVAASGVAGLLLGSLLGFIGARCIAASGVGLLLGLLDGGGPADAWPPVGSDPDKLQTWLAQC